METPGPDMDRRSALRAVATGGTALLAGCSAIGRGDGDVAVTVRAVDVLNRRSTSATVTFVAERNGDVVVDRAVDVQGTENTSRPTAAEITAFADDPGRYRFELSVEAGKTLETTPAELGVTGSGASCVRVVFVLNVDDRLTAHARTPCEGG